MVLEVANKPKNQVDGEGIRRNQGFVSSYKQKWRRANGEGAATLRAEKERKRMKN